MGRGRRGKPEHEQRNEHRRGRSGGDKHRSPPSGGRRMWGWVKAYQAPWCRKSRQPPHQGCVRDREGWGAPAEGKAATARAPAHLVTRALVEGKAATMKGTRGGHAATQFPSLGVQPGYPGVITTTTTPGPLAFGKHVTRNVFPTAVGARLVSQPTVIVTYLDHWRTQPEQQLLTAVLR